MIKFSLRWKFGYWAKYPKDQKEKSKYKIKGEVRGKVSFVVGLIFHLGQKFSINNVSISSRGPERKRKQENKLLPIDIEETSLKIKTISWKITLLILNTDITAHGLIIKGEGPRGFPRMVIVLLFGHWKREWSSNFGFYRIKDKNWIFSWEGSCFNPPYPPPPMRIY